MPTTELMIIALERHRQEPDQHSFDEFWKLVERHRAELLAQAYAMLGSMEDAEDVVQETLRIAFQKVMSLQDPGRIPKWLRCINRNISLHVLRRKRTERKATKRLQAIKESDTAAPAPQPGNDLRDAVIRAIDGLPEQLRPVILLRYAEELSYEQIAERLGIPLGTVKSRMMRADRLLQVRLARLYRSATDGGDKHG